jgi:putative solute:sodium symporter small subunit
VAVDTGFPRLWISLDAGRPPCHSGPFPAGQIGETHAMRLLAKERFWARTVRLTVLLLAVWLAANLMVPWWAADLNRWTAWGFPLGYWLVAEGLLLLYLAIIVLYVLVMERQEGRYVRGAGPGAGCDLTRSQADSDSERP